MIVWHSFRVHWSRSNTTPRVETLGYCMSDFQSDIVYDKNQSDIVYDNNQSDIVYENNQSDFIYKKKKKERSVSRHPAHKLDMIR